MGTTPVWQVLHNSVFTRDSLKGVRTMPFYCTLQLLKPMILKIIHFLREECKIKGGGEKIKGGGFKKGGGTFKKGG